MNAPLKQRTTQQLGHSNSLAVFNEVLFDAPVPRADIAKRTNLTATSVSRITRQLIDAGLVEEFEVHKTGRPGRQSINLRLKQDGGYVIGISINAFEQRIALANLERAIIAEAALPRDVLDPKRAAKIAAGEVKALLRKHRIERGRVFGIGMANAGVVDPEKNVVVRAPTLGWHDVSLGREIEKELAIPVRMNNLAGAIAAAEHRFGIARKLRNFIVVHTTLGIGMCMVVDGRALHGHLNQAGLIGEIPIQTQRWVELDAVSGGTAMVRKWLSDRDPSILETPIRRSHLEQLAQAVRQGDQKAIAACDEGSKQLGGLIVTLAAALSSEAVLFVGPLMQIEQYRSRVEAMLRDALSARRSVEVIFSERRGVEAAYMLAISELATTGAHLEQLLRR